MSKSDSLAAAAAVANDDDDRVTCRQCLNDCCALNVIALKFHFSDVRVHCFVAVWHRTYECRWICCTVIDWLK